MGELPRIISVDDHVQEPPDLWWNRLPAKLRERGPHVRREKGVFSHFAATRWTHDPDLEGARWADVWYYDGGIDPVVRGGARVGHEDESPGLPITYDEVVPGAYQRDARLDDMDANHTDVSLCFPNVPRFCGQIFLEGADKDLALLGVQAYNDWMIDEWCGSERPARLVPLTIVPLWDPALAAAEVERCAAKGAHAITFSENLVALGLPSIFSSHWDPLFAACDATDTVINLHVGSSSTLLMSAPDAPPAMALAFLFVNAEMAFSDWLFSGVLEEFPNLRLVLSESQVGWMPFVMQRMDNSWKKFAGDSRNDERRCARELPSNVVPGRVFGSIFDDLEGLQRRDVLGVEQIMVETDYPHTDSTYPNSKKILTELVTAAGLSDDEIMKVIRTNAIKVYGLDRYFGIEQ
jgi:predicted TIM-barrel fold metal-dependent hydrolase